MGEESDGGSRPNRKETYRVRGRPAHEEAVRREQAPQQARACALCGWHSGAAVRWQDVPHGRFPGVARLCLEEPGACSSLLGLSQLVHGGHGVELLHRRRLARHRPLQRIQAGKVVPESRVVRAQDWERVGCVLQGTHLGGERGQPAPRGTQEAAQRPRGRPKEGGEQGGSEHGRSGYSWRGEEGKLGC